VTFVHRLLAFIGVCRENHITQNFLLRFRDHYEKNATNGNQKQTVRRRESIVSGKKKNVHRNAK
jgi:hypothetical protein